MFKFWMYQLGAFLVNHLPSKVSYRLGVFLSDLHYLFSFRDQRLVRNNLKIILETDKNFSPLAREVFRNFGRYLVEFFRMARHVDLNFIQEKVRVKNLEYIEEVLEKGKGGILVSGHIGNWELGAAVISLMGFPPTVIALPHKERPVNDLFNYQRQIKGITVIPVSNSVRKSIETLRGNGVMALNVDRDFSANGEILDFFGKKTLIPKGAAIFSCKTGAAIIPIFLIREAEDSFTLEICEPIYPSRIVEGIVDEDSLVALMKQYAKIMEDKIRQYPTQWLMFREFWVK